MDFHELIRSFFGFPRYSRPNFGNEAPDSHFFGDFGMDQSEQDEVEDGGRPRSDFGFGQSDMFGNTFFMEPFDMMKKMDEMMSKFGMPNFPFLEMGSLEPPDNNAVPPRDRMLKLPDSSEEPSYFGHRPTDSNKMLRDLDLDKEVERKGISELFEGDRSPRTFSHPKPHEHFQSRSVRIQKFIGPDGRVEERKVCKDSQGNEETTVQRSLGNQKHVLQTIVDSKGNETVNENFVNMDEKNLSEFDKKWQGLGIPEQKMLKDSSQRGVNIHDKSYSSIFKNLFGFNPQDKP